MDLLSARQQRAVLSIVIAAILGSQLVVGMVDTGRWGWPIMAYPMYKSAHFEGERLSHEFDLFAVFQDGTRVKIPATS
jgi:hypothetical protein